MGLHKAVNSGNINIIKQLLDAKADVNIQPRLNETQAKFYGNPTPIMASVSSQPPEVMKLLLDAKADTTIKCRPFMKKPEVTVLEWVTALKMQHPGEEKYGTMIDHLGGKPAVLDEETKKKLQESGCKFAEGFVQMANSEDTKKELIEHARAVDAQNTSVQTAVLLNHVGS